MVATLQSRKEALEAKILEKNEELKKLCLQEAELTGVMPPEIPLEPGEPLPPIRRRVGTSFSFPQSLINNVKDADEDTLTALELECKVQTNIAEAALALANDTSANKAARRKHRLMYRQSQRRLLELETRLNLLRQGKSQQLKPQQIKKKPRPNTTAVENIGFLWNKAEDIKSNSFSGGHLGSWPGKIKPEYSIDDLDGTREFFQQNDGFGSLYKCYKSNQTSQSSGSSPKTDFENDEFKLGASQLFNSNCYSNRLPGSSSLTHSNTLDLEMHKSNLTSNPQYHKKVGKRGVVRRQWDTQSTGGTLLPSQTYPDHSHQPNLSRTQSLGSVESNPQKSKDSWSIQDFTYENNTTKEKEWYETSLDSAPSPPLRTTSKLPSTARMLYQMNEIQARDLGNWSGTNVNSLQSSNSHPALPTTPNMIHKTVMRSASAYPTTENILNSLQQMHLHPNAKGRNSGKSFDGPEKCNQKDMYFDCTNNENKQLLNYPTNFTEQIIEEVHYQTEGKPKLELQYQGVSNDQRLLPSSENLLGLPLVRQNSLNQSQYKNIDATDSGNSKHDCDYKSNDAVYINIPEDNSDLIAPIWISDDDYPNHKKGTQIAVPQEYSSKTQTTTQPYYHALKNSPGEKIKNLQYQASRNRRASVAEEQGNYQSGSLTQPGTQHPPHAITQNEISFDTVVPFESPQNHTVVQAGKWQPYREITKPFEMSDFYKYSTKFRQNKGNGNRSATPEISRNSPNTIHHKSVYLPLRPMTCQPVESRNNQMLMGSQYRTHYDEVEKPLVEVSSPEIV